MSGQTRGLLNRREFISKTAAAGTAMYLGLGNDLGMAAVDRLPPLKKFLMRHAMGAVGDLPRLVKGEAL